METITSAELTRHLGRYTDRALVEPVLITRNGRERLVLLAAQEFHRLRRFDREALPVTALSADDLALIAQAEVPVAHAHLDDELNG